MGKMREILYGVGNQGTHKSTHKMVRVLLLLSLLDQTQGFIPAKQALYHLGYAPSPFVCTLILRLGLVNFAQAGRKLVILMSLPSE
jgi:hypothetical protein